MNDGEVEPFAISGIPITTACGGTTTLTRATPSTQYKGQTYFFCMQSCKELYEKEPLNSCLAAKLLHTD